MQLAFLCILSVAHASIINIRPETDTLINAFAVVAPGDVIMMGPGIYSGKGNCGLTLNVPNVKLVGDYAASLACSDPLVISSNGCVIQGLRFQNGAKGCVSVTGSNTVFYESEFFNCSSKSTGGAISIRTSSGATTLDHVRISLSSASSNGGAVYASGALNISNSIFRNNTAGTSGGAVYAGGGNVSISGWSMFASNTAVLHGGAIYILDSWGRVSDDVHCVSNTAGTNGGCICTSKAFLVISDRVLFDGNQAGFNGGGVYTPGPLPLSPSVTVQDNVVFRRNQGVTGGGLSARIPIVSGSVLFEDNVANYGGGMAGYGNVVTPVSATVVGNVVFRNNRAITSQYTPNGLGGGLYFFAYSHGHVGENVLFDSNSAPGGFGGGLLVMYNTDVRVDGDVKFYNNTAMQGGAVGVFAGSSGVGLASGVIALGGNVLLKRNYATTLGGGLYSYVSRVTIVESVRIEENVALSAGGGVCTFQSTVNISGNVALWNNTAVARGGGAFFTTTSVNEFNAINAAYISGGVIIAHNRVTGSPGDGGGIATQDSHLDIRGNIVIRNNQVPGFGGGMFLVQFDRETTNALQGDVVIRDNAALSGGGIMANKTNLTMACCVSILNNTARVNGGALAGVSGSKVRMQGAYVAANIALKDGGGAYLEDVSEAELSNSKVFANVAQQGGGISLVASARCNLTQRTLVSSNYATWGGGAAVLDTAGLTVDNADFLNNAAASDGGGIFGQGSVVLDHSASIRSCSANRGGAVFSSGVGITVGATAEISENAATTDGGGIFMYSPVDLSGNLRDNVAAGNGGAVFASGADARLTVSYDSTVLVENNTAGKNGGGMYFEDAATFVVSKETCQSECNPNVRGDGVCDVQCMTRGCNWDNGDCNAKYTSPDANKPCDPQLCPADLMMYTALVGDCYVHCFASSCDWSRQLCQGQRDAISQCPLFDLAVYDSAPPQAYAITAIGPMRCSSRECDGWPETNNRASQDAIVGQQSLDTAKAWVFVTNTTELQAVIKTMTLELWVKGRAGTIVSSRYVDLVVSTSSIVLWFRNSSGNCSEVWPRTTSDAWTHLAVVFADMAHVNVDGVTLDRTGGTCERVHPFFGGPLLDSLHYTIQGSSDSFVSQDGFAIGRSGGSLLVDGFRLWAVNRSETQIRKTIRAPCNNVGAILCYEFGNSSVVLDRGIGELSFGYVVAAEAPTCSILGADGTGWCIAQKPNLPSMGAAYDKRDVEKLIQRVGSMDFTSIQAIPQSTQLSGRTVSAFSGCAQFPLRFRGNRAFTGGAIYQSGCNTGLDGHGICFFSGMSTSSGAAVVAFEHNSATLGGGAVFTDCDSVLSTCAAMLPSRLGVPGVRSDGYSRLFFSNNTAGGYGPNFATAPSQLIVPGKIRNTSRVTPVTDLSRFGSNRVTGYVPGQESLNLSLVLLDGVGTVVSGSQDVALSYVLVLLFCQGPDGCDFQTAIHAPYFLTVDVDVVHTTGIDIVCPGAGVYAYFYLSGSTSVYLAQTIPLQCKPCQAGQQRVQAARYWSCISCLPTQYIVDPNKHTCRKCPVGGTCDGSGLIGLDGSTWVVTDDIYRLQSCPAGYILIRDNSSNCLTGINSDECKAGPELDRCFRCPGSPAPGRFSLLPATYPGPLVSPTVDTVTEIQCRPCPFGANCESGGSSVVPLPGYWTTRTRRAVDDGSPTMYKCLPDLCTGNNECTEGHAGFVCGVCLENYTHSGTRCIVCGSDESLRAGRIVGVVSLVLAFLASWGFVSVAPFVSIVRQAPPTPPSSRRTSLVETIKGKFEKLANKIKTSQLPIIMGILKILMTFYQVTSCFWTAFDVPWPQELDDFFHGSTVTKGDIFTIPSFACLSRDWSRGDRLLFYTVTPPAITLLWALPLAVGRVALFSAEQLKSVAFKALKAKFFNAVSAHPMLAHSAAYDLPVADARVPVPDLPHVFDRRAGHLQLHPDREHVLAHKRPPPDLPHVPVYQLAVCLDRHMHVFVSLRHPVAHASRAVLL